MQNLAQMTTLCLHHLLQGQLPFRGEGTKELYRAISRGVFEPIGDELSAELRDLVRRMLAVDAVRRSSCAKLCALQGLWTRVAPSSA